MPIRNKQPDDDAGRKIVDEQLIDLEARLTSMYETAAKEMKSDLDKFMSKYEAKDEENKAKVASGEMSQKEYQNWKDRQIFRSDAMKAKIEDLTTRAVNADKQAMAMVNDQLPETYATSYNFGGFRGETYANAAGFDYTQFTIINQEAVKELMTKDPDLIPWKTDPDLAEDKKWNRQHIQEAVRQGIVKGDSMDKIADRLLPVVNMDKNAAIRTARTAVNGIENKGRKDATERVKEAGIPMDEMWSSTHDGRTRDTHILLDKTYPNDQGLFGEGIIPTGNLLEYPGDPSGDPEEVYNCRCGLLSFIKGIDHSKDDDLYAQMMEEEHFDDWLKVKEDMQKKEEAFQKNKEGAAERVEARRERYEEQKAEESNNVTENTDDNNVTDVEKNEEKMVQNIEEKASDSYVKERQADVVQGKDITGTWERREDKYQFAIQDVINAQGFDGVPSVYNEADFNKAVEESNFIAQRTYSAPDQETLDSYRDMLYNGEWYVDCSTGGAQYGQGMYCAADYTGTITDGMKEEMDHYKAINRLYDEDGNKVTYFQMQNDAIASKYEELTGREYDRSDYDSNAYNEARSYVNNYMNRDDTTYESFIDEFDLPYSLSQSYTETLTLTPDAKILDIHDEEDVINYLADEYAMNKVTDEKQKEVLEEFIDIQHKIDNERNPDKLDALYDERDKVTDTKEWNEVQEYRSEFYGKYGNMDAGVVATLMGYDAINAQGHGKSGSYTVILNRTKVIFKKGGD